MTEKGKRISDLIAYFGLNKNSFSAEIGFTNNVTIGRILNEERNPSPNTISMILKRFPQVNPDWLKFGKEPMIFDSKQLPTTSHEPGRSDYMHIVPLLPVSAQGGSFNDFVESIKESDCEKIVSPVKAADFAITVSGDSMMPRFPSGCKILIKKVNEKAFIEWGHVYVLDTCNGVVIKKIEPGNDEHELVCESFNPAYKPFKVNMDDIYGVYKVIMMMTLE